MKYVVAMIITVLSVGATLPSFAQLYYNDQSSSTSSSAPQNQVKLTDKGDLMVGFYTDPQSPTTSSQTSFQISFANKGDAGIVIPNVSYTISVTRGDSPVFQSPVLQSPQGTASVQYQFLEPGSYAVTVYVSGMNSKQIPQEAATFAVDVSGSSTSAVPEFPSPVIIFGVATASVVAAISAASRKLTI
ncbi:MAG: hypothetical protein KGI27_10185 [Thaumarchaeota archaeon]|nr:hypothetical protein [Nitrososphaerota archaeon]